MDHSIPEPLTIQEIVARGGILGDDSAWDEEGGFHYDGPCADVFCYRGAAFTGIYYERYPSGALEHYWHYRSGCPVECFAFYESGRLRFYNHPPTGQYTFAEDGRMTRAFYRENGRYHLEDY